MAKNLERKNAHRILRECYNEAWNEIEQAILDHETETAFVKNFGALRIYGEIDTTGIKYLEAYRFRSFQDFPAIMDALRDTLPSWEDVAAEMHEEEDEEYYDPIWDSKCQRELDISRRKF